MFNYIQSYNFFLLGKLSIKMNKKLKFMYAFVYYYITNYINAVVYQCQYYLKILFCLQKHKVISQKTYFKIFELKIMKI